MKNYSVQETETTKRYTFEVIITGENLQTVTDMKKPEWATRPPMVTYGNDKTFIAWTRDQKVRPYLP